MATTDLRLSKGAELCCLNVEDFSGLSYEHIRWTPETDRGRGKKEGLKNPREIKRGKEGEGTAPAGASVIPLVPPCASVGCCPWPLVLNLFGAESPNWNKRPAIYSLCC